jgi:hypothetical protein
VWSQQAYLKPSNTAVYQLFGKSVAVSGDTIAVGASAESSSAKGIGGDETNTSAPNAGAVYVFKRTGTTWAQEAYVKASNTLAEQYFGASVTLDGDTLAVGGPVEASAATGINGDQTDTTSKGTGAVYVFTRTGTTWTQQVYLKPSYNFIQTADTMTFGTSLAVSGDTLAVGAIGDNRLASGINGAVSMQGATLNGAVFVFVRNGSTWTQAAYLKPSTYLPTNRQFGASLALEGNKLVVGATFDHTDAHGVNGAQNEKNGSAGSAFLFVRNGSSWTQHAFVTPSNEGGYFGCAVGLGNGTLVVGSRQETGQGKGIDAAQTPVASGISTGAVYVFE